MFIEHGAMTFFVVAIVFGFLTGGIFFIIFKFFNK